MITSVAIGTFLSAYEETILSFPHVAPYVLPGWSYTSNLGFDDKVRKKIVLQDDKFLAAKDKPIWLAKLWNREVLKISTVAGSRPFKATGPRVLCGDAVSGYHVQLVPFREAAVSVPIGLISNSPTLLEHIEELTFLSEFRQNYQANFSVISDPRFNELLESYAPFTISATDFTVDSLTKEDTSQYGPIAQLTMTATLTFPITVPATTYPLIHSINLELIENYLF